MTDKIETHICKILRTKLGLWDLSVNGDKATVKNVLIEIQNPKDNVVELNFIYDDKDHTFEMNASQARNIANMLFAVANEAHDEYADMRPPAECKPTKKKK